MISVESIGIGGPLATRKRAKVLLLDAYNNKSMELEFWPSTLSDSKDVNYEVKSIPGSSVPIRHWVSSGERKISFTVVLVCEVDPGQNLGSAGGTSIPIVNSQIGKHLQQYSSTARGIVDINKAVRWLRSFMYPSYDQNDGHSIPPHQMMVIFPGTQLDERLRESSFLGQVVGCPVEYKLWFPSGAPRFATVELTIAQALESPLRRDAPTNEDLQPD